MGDAFCERLVNGPAVADQRFPHNLRSYPELAREILAHRPSDELQSLAWSFLRSVIDLFRNIILAVPSLKPYVMGT